MKFTLSLLFQGETGKGKIKWNKEQDLKGIEEQHWRETEASNLNWVDFKSQLLEAGTPGIRGMHTDDSITIVKHWLFVFS